MKCPLCLDFPVGTRKAYETHVGAHLEDVALACLPKDAESDDEEDSDLSDSGFSKELTNASVMAEMLLRRPNERGSETLEYAPARLRGSKANPFTVSNERTTARFSTAHVPPEAVKLGGDSVRESRGTSNIWLQSGNEYRPLDPIARFYTPNSSSEEWKTERVTGVVSVDSSPQAPHKGQRVKGIAAGESTIQPSASIPPGEPPHLEQ